MTEHHEPLTLAPFGTGCPCVETHCPSSYVLVVHHVIPRSWDGPDVAANRREVCSNTHDATHRLLDDYVRYDRAGLGEPPWEHRRKFNALARVMAAHAWANRPSTPTFTMHAYRTPDPHEG